MQTVLSFFVFSHSKNIIIHNFHSVECASVIRSVFYNHWKKIWIIFWSLWLTFNRRLLEHSKPNPVKINKIQLDNLFLIDTIWNYLQYLTKKKLKFRSFDFFCFLALRCFKQVGYKHLGTALRKSWCCFTQSYFISFRIKNIMIADNIVQKENFSIKIQRNSLKMNFHFGLSNSVI